LIVAYGSCYTDAVQDISSDDFSAIRQAYWYCKLGLVGQAYTPQISDLIQQAIRLECWERSCLSDMASIPTSMEIEAERNKARQFFRSAHKAGFGPLFADLVLLRLRLGQLLSPKWRKCQSGQLSPKQHPWRGVALVYELILR